MASDECPSDDDDSYRAIGELELQALYSPGYYAKAEELCVEILERIDPDSELALLYLVLSLAAQDATDEALELVEELADDSLLEALRHIAFGRGTKTEGAVYQTIIQIARERGRGEELDLYLNQKDVPMARPASSPHSKHWQTRRLQAPLDEVVVDELN